MPEVLKEKSPSLWERVRDAVFSSAKKEEVAKGPSQKELLQQVMDATVEQIRSVEALGEGGKTSTEEASHTATSGSSASTVVPVVATVQEIKFPEKTIMAKEVHRSIEKEMHACVKQAHHLARKKGAFAHEVQKLIARARELREILGKLVNATVEWIQGMYREWVVGKG
jgi:hypothetical protein